MTSRQGLQAQANRVQAKSVVKQKEKDWNEVAGRSAHKVEATEWQSLYFLYKYTLCFSNIKASIRETKKKEQSNK